MKKNTKCDWSNFSSVLIERGSRVECRCPSNEWYDLSRRGREYRSVGPVRGDALVVTDVILRPEGYDELRCAQNEAYLRFAEYPGLDYPAKYFTLADPAPSTPQWSDAPARVVVVDVIN